MKSKIALFLIVYSTISNQLNAQNRQYKGVYIPGEEDPGLPSLNNSGIAFVAAIVFLGLGWIFYKINEKPNGEGGSVLAYIFLMIGVLCLFPALAWLAQILQIFWIVAIAIIGIIIAYSLFFKRD